MVINNADLKAIFLAAAEREFLDVPAEKSLNHVFSPEFVEWGKTMVPHQPVITKAKTVKQIIRIVLIAALVAALLAGTALAIPAVRNMVKKFFVSQDENNVHYIDFDNYNSNEPCVEYTETTEIGDDGVSPITKVEVALRAEAEYIVDPTTDQPGVSLPIEYRSPTYVPDMLVVESEVTTPAVITIVMRGANEQLCIYKQSAHPNNSNVGVAIAIGDDYVHSEETVCDTLMSVFRCETTTIFIWEDEYYLYRLLVNADMPMEEAERIIYSIEPRDDLNNP